MANILVLDDEPSILEVIKIGLEKDGHIVTVLDNSEDVSKIKINFYDIILLDIMMPKKDGYSVLKEMRVATDSPIIFLTAKSAEDDIIYGFGLGADDYLIKPFRIPELRARINAHLRRESREHQISLNIGNFRFNLLTKELHFNNELLLLTKGEYEICEYLATHRHQIFSRDQIYEAVFGYDYDGESNSIATHIKNIRKKFVNTYNFPIKTKWGVGYLWE